MLDPPNRVAPERGIAESSSYLQGHPHRPASHRAPRQTTPVTPSPHPRATDAAPRAGLVPCAEILRTALTVRNGRKLPSPVPVASPSCPT